MDFEDECKRRGGRFQKKGNTVRACSFDISEIDKAIKLKEDFSKLNQNVLTSIKDNEIEVIHMRRALENKEIARERIPTTRLEQPKRIKHIDFSESNLDISRKIILPRSKPFEKETFRKQKEVKEPAITISFPKPTNPDFKREVISCFSEENLAVKEEGYIIKKLWTLTDVETIINISIPVLTYFLPRIKKGIDRIRELKIKTSIVFKIERENDYILVYIGYVSKQDLDDALSKLLDYLSNNKPKSIFIWYNEKLKVWGDYEDTKKWRL